MNKIVSRIKTAAALVAAAGATVATATVLPAVTVALPVAAVTVTVAAAVVSPAAAAAEESRMAMTPYSASTHDKISLQRGAKLFVNYCLSCHSAQFMRYSRMAEDLEIPPEVVTRNMLFAADKIGEVMQTTMPADAAEEWFGVAPPDLSLIARLRGDEWLYNYFATFYLDADSPSGWNNVVFENVAMPHAMHELQGLQRAVFTAETDADGNTREVLAGFEQVTAGKMSPAEYDQAIRDLTNFLVYVGEPSRDTRIYAGLWVMVFLTLFATLAWLLKKEYWRDIQSG